MKKRLDQILANHGLCSRRDAHKLVRSGRITIGGEAPKSGGDKVLARDVHVDGSPLDHPDGIFIILNKPVGYSCTHDESEGPIVLDLLPPAWRERTPAVTTVGRLDKETSGAILVTDQGEWVHRLTSPKHKVPKRYLATIARPLPTDAAATLASGTLVLEGETEPCLPARLETISETQVRIILTEGRYHQVRRMIAALGSHVEALHRESFGDYDCSDLATGQWRDTSMPDGSRLD